MRRASQLLARHVDDRARATLEEVRRAAPAYHAAERWLAALAARRVGRIAVTSTPPEHGRLEAAFWLDGQRPVWLRPGPADAAERLAREAELQATLALPNVAPVVEHGVASGISYVAVVAAGRPWTLDSSRPLDAATALALASQAVRVYRALALASVALPDADPNRFCITGDRTPVITLADLDGAEATPTEEANATNGNAAASLLRRLLPNALLPDALRTAMESRDARALAIAVDHATLHTEPRT
jgi:hypothetical protein